MGISGSYRNIRAGGYVDSDGFDVFSLLNMGAGQAHIWTVSPKFNWFLANDFALGLRLDYSGYWIDTDVRLDLREVVGKFFEKTEASFLKRQMWWIRPQMKARRPWRP